MPSILVYMDYRLSKLHGPLKSLVHNTCNKDSVKSNVTDKMKYVQLQAFHLFFTDYLSPVLPISSLTLTVPCRLTCKNLSLPLYFTDYIKASFSISIKLYNAFDTLSCTFVFTVLQFTRLLNRHTWHTLNQIGNHCTEMGSHVLKNLHLFIIFSFQ